MKGPARKTAVHTNPTQDQDYNELYDALLELKTRSECQRFLMDLCTPAELQAFAERWKVAQLLATQNLSYRDIHQQTGVSITTVGRVARFLQQEAYQGYMLMIERLKEKRTGKK